MSGLYLRLTNYKCFPFKELTFPAGLVMVSGESGVGKSTLFKAMIFAFCGTGKTGTGKTEVVLKYQGVTITRTARPAHLVVEIDGVVTLNNIAQDHINNRFPFAEQLYYSQRDWARSFTLMTDGARSAFLKEVIFEFNTTEFERRWLNDRDEAKTEITKTTGLIESTDAILSSGVFVNLEGKILELETALKGAEKEDIDAKYINDRSRELSDRQKELLQFQSWIDLNSGKFAIHKKNVTRAHELDLLLSHYQHNPIVDVEKIGRCIHLQKEYPDRHLLKDMSSSIAMAKERLADVEKREELLRRRNELPLVEDADALEKQVEMAEATLSKITLIIKLQKQHRVALSTKNNIDHSDYIRAAEATNTLSKEREAILKTLTEMRAGMTYTISDLVEKRNAYQQETDDLASQVLVNRKYTCPQCETDLMIEKGKLISISPNHTLKNHAPRLRELAKHIQELDRLIGDATFNEHRVKELEKRLGEIPDCEWVDVTEMDRETKAYQTVEEIRTMYGITREELYGSYNVSRTKAEVKRVKEMRDKNSSVVHELIRIDKEIPRIDKRLAGKDVVTQEELNRMIELDNRWHVFISYLTTWELTTQDVDTDYSSVDLNQERSRTTEYNDLVAERKAIGALDFNVVEYETRLRNRDQLAKMIEELAEYQQMHTRYTDRQKALLMEECLKDARGHVSTRDELQFNLKSYKASLESSTYRLHMLKLFAECVNWATVQHEKVALETIDALVDSYTDRLFVDRLIKCKLELIPAGIRIDITLDGIEMKISDLSHGELARVSLAYSLAFSRFINTPLLIFDECFGSFSETITLDVVKILRDEALGRDILCVAHSSPSGMYDSIVQIQ